MGAIGAEPRFDTSGLGTEVALQPVAEVGSALRDASRLPGVSGLTTVGRLSNPQALVVRSQGEFAPCHAVEYSEGLTAECWDEPVSGPAPMWPHIVGIPVMGWWNLPANTSIVGIDVVDGLSMWQRPVDQSVVFPFPEDVDPRVHLTAFDPEGEVVYEMAYRPGAGGSFEATVGALPEGVPDVVVIASGQAHSWRNGLATDRPEPLVAALPVDDDGLMFQVESGSIYHQESRGARADLLVEPTPGDVLVLHDVDPMGAAIVSVGVAEYINESASVLLGRLDPETEELTILADLFEAPLWAGITRVSSSESGYLVTAVTESTGLLVLFDQNGRQMVTPSLPEAEPPQIAFEVPFQQADLCARRI